MKTPFDSSLLSGYLDGELDAEEIALVERVLDEQPERRRELEGLRHLQQTLAALPTPQPITDPVAGVRAKIEKRLPAAMEPSRRWWLRVTPFILAACLLLGVGWMMSWSEITPSQLVSERSVDRVGEIAEKQTDDEKFAASLFSQEDSARPSRGSEEATSAFAVPEESRGPLWQELDSLPPSRPEGPPTSQQMQAPPEPASRSARSQSMALSFEQEDAAPQDRGDARSMMRSSPEAGSAGLAPQPPADAAYNFRRDTGAPSALMPRLSETGSEQQPDMQNAVRLRYEVPPDDRAETIRWLRTVVPRELKELSPAGDVKRYWFAGVPSEQQELQAAIKKRLEVTEGQLKVVQSADAAGATGQAVVRRNRGAPSTSGGAEEADASPKAAVKPLEESMSGGDQPTRDTDLTEGKPEAKRSAASDSQPTAIIIELYTPSDE